MQAVEFLNRIRYIDMLIDCKVQQVAELRNRLLPSAIRYDKDKVQSSVGGDSMADTMGKIIELEKDINKDIDELVDMKKKAIGLMKKLDSKEQIILYKRYLERKTFEQIAVDCGYSWRTVHRLHKGSLKSFEKVFDKYDITTL